jgi:predicted porin
MRFWVRGTALFALAAASIGAQAQDSLQIYGSMGVGLNYRNHQTGGGSAVDLSNNQISSSYFGMRGQEDLGGGMRALFRLESGISTDTGATGSNGKFFNRQSFVGLAQDKVATVTLGRQFHAHVDRVVQSLDVYNAGGPGLHTGPIGLFGVNRFSGNDSRVDDSIKIRVQGPAGTTAAVSYGNNEGAGKSVAFDLAQLTPGYVIGVYGVRYASPTPIAATGETPHHTAVGAGGNVNFGPTRLYLNLIRSTVDATAAGRPSQENKIISVGVRHDMNPVVLKAAYTHDRGENVSTVAGRNGNKNTWVITAEYLFSRRTTAYVGAFSNAFTDGYKLDPVNIAGLSRDPAAARTSGYSIGMRHEF